MFSAPVSRATSKAALIIISFVAFTFAGIFAPPNIIRIIYNSNYISKKYFCQAHKGMVYTIFIIQ